MLHLRAQTEAHWLDRALLSLDDVLLDHAHCERKAASTAVSLIFRYTDYPVLMTPLSEIAREELAHFELMLGELSHRGVQWKRQRPSAYAGRLMKVVRVEEPDRLLDMLLCCAFIEARSCERMGLLAGGLQDARLKNVYEGLLKAEARHHAFYIDLAKAIFSPDEVMARMEEVGEFEGEVIRTARPEDRLHG